MIKIIKYCVPIIMLFIGCGKQEIHKQTSLAMDTVIEISVVDKHKDPEGIRRAIDNAFGEIKRIEGLMDRHDEDSEVSRINSRGGEERIQVSDETREAIKQAFTLSRVTRGAFDITILPLLRLWGEGEEECLVSEQEINETLDLVGSDKIIIDNQKVGFARPGMGIDLGGIAKGYAVDQSVRSLRSDGIKSALVNAGGDIFCLGTRSPRQEWSVGVKHPRKPGQVLTVLKVKDRAVATSGDYERMGHIIDPRTGLPAEKAPISVTILAPNCTVADSLATAVFVLGSLEGMELINNLEHVEGIVISGKGEGIEIDVSKGLHGKLEFRP